MFSLGMTLGRLSVDGKRLRRRPASGCRRLFFADDLRQEFHSATCGNRERARRMREKAAGRRKRAGR
jgi:hypothetical protein